MPSSSVELPRKTQTLSPQLPTWAWHSWSRSEIISFTASWSPTWIHSMQEALWEESQKSLIYEYRMQFCSPGVYWSCIIDNFNVVEPKLQKCACHSHGGRCLPSRRNGLRPQEAKNVCEFFGGRFSSLWGLAGLPGNCLAGRVFGEYKVHKWGMISSNVHIINTRAVESCLLSFILNWMFSIYGYFMIKFYGIWSSISMLCYMDIWISVTWLWR